MLKEKDNNKKVESGLKIMSCLVFHERIRHFIFIWSQCDSSVGYYWIGYDVLPTGATQH